MKFSTIAFTSLIGSAVASPLFSQVYKREAAASPAFAKGMSIPPITFYPYKS